MSALLVTSPDDPLDPGYDLLVFDTTPGAEHVWTIDSAGNLLSGDLRLTRQQVRDVGVAVLYAWQGVIGREAGPTPFQVGVTQDRKAEAEARVSLAATGSYALRQLLEAMDDHMAATVAQKIDAHLVQPATSLRPLVFKAEILFPWRLLYALPGRVGEQVDEGDEEDEPGAVPYAGFLGLAGIVDVMAPGQPPSARRGGTVPIAVYPEFDAAAGGRRDVTDALKARGDLRPQFSYDEKAFSRTIAEDNAALIYALCHGSFGAATGGAKVQGLKISTKVVDAQYFARRVRKQVDRLSTQPIAFVNACQGGVFEADSDTTILAALRNCGADATLGPLVDMPTTFGGRFGAAVLSRLAAGETLAQAVLTCTRAFVTEHLNPLGLTYMSTNARNARLP